MSRRRFALVGRSLEFIHPHRRTFVAVVALAVLMSAVSAADPLVMKYLFDQLALGPAPERLALLMGLLLAAELGRAVLTAWLGALSWDARLGVEYMLRERVFGKLSRLPMSYHQQEGVGATVNRVNQSIASFVTACSDICFNLLPTLLYLGLSIGMMLRLEWRLAVAVLAFTPLPALIGLWAAPEQTRRERRLVERWSSVYARLNEVLTGMATVKSFAMEDAEQCRFLNGVRRGFDLVRRGVRRDNRTGALRGLAGTLARLTALGLGALLLWEGKITLGTLVAVLGYIGGLFGPVQNLTNTYQTFRKASVALDILLEILDADEGVRDDPGAQDVQTLRGEVRLENVSFAYRPGAPVLRNVTLHIQPGETVALVGPSGSGKSTVAALLQRLYAPTEGRVLFDGVDVRRLTQRSLRRQLGVVLQEPYLFNETVRANIAYGRPEATQAEIEAAARAAHAHEFIMALPKGYDTVVHERGAGLSGGQRQRIAIARALLLDPPLLILDEPTSALDAESEAAIQTALRTLLRRRTGIIIAHRLSTVVDADRIVVLQDGRITEVGTHLELLRRGGYYAEMVARQTNGFIAVQAA